MHGPTTPSATTGARLPPCQGRRRHKCRQRTQTASRSLATTPQWPPTRNVRDLGHQFFQNQSCERNFNSNGGGLNSMWPRKYKLERKMLHLMGRQLENVTNVCKQIVGLAGHNASFAFDGVEKKRFFSLNSPKMHRCPRHGKTQVDKLTIRM